MAIPKNWTVGDVKVHQIGQCMGTELTTLLKKTCSVEVEAHDKRWMINKNSSVETNTSSTKAIQGIHLISNKVNPGVASNKLINSTACRVRRVFYFPTPSVMPLIH